LRDSVARAAAGGVVLVQIYEVRLWGFVDQRRLEGSASWFVGIGSKVCPVLCAMCVFVCLCEYMEMSLFVECVFVGTLRERVYRYVF
jgi:hypothetical protein